MREFLIIIVLFSITTFAMAASTELTCPPGMFIDKDLCTIEIKDVRKAGTALPDKVMGANYYIDNHKLFHTVAQATLNCPGNQTIINGVCTKVLSSTTEIVGSLPNTAIGTKYNFLSKKLYHVEPAQANTCSAGYAPSGGKCRKRITKMSLAPTTIPNKAMGTRLYIASKKLYFLASQAVTKCPAGQWLQSGICTRSITSMSQVGSNLQNAMLSPYYFIKNQKLYSSVFGGSCPPPKVKYPIGPTHLCGTNIDLAQVGGDFPEGNSLSGGYFIWNHKMFYRGSPPSPQCPAGHTLAGGWCVKQVDNLSEVESHFVNTDIGNGYSISNKKLYHTLCATNQIVHQNSCMKEIVNLTGLGSDFSNKVINSKYYVENRKLYSKELAPTDECPTGQTTLNGFCIKEIIYTNQVGSDFPNVEIGNNFFTKNRKLFKRGIPPVKGRGRTNRR